MPLKSRICDAIAPGFFAFCTSAPDVPERRGRPAADVQLAMTTGPKEPMRPLVDRGGAVARSGTSPISSLRANEGSIEHVRPSEVVRTHSLCTAHTDELTEATQAGR